MRGAVRSDLDVRRFQIAVDFGFTPESQQSFGVTSDRFRQDLDGDRPVQTSVRRLVNLPHAAHTDPGGDLTGAEASAGGEGQVAELYGSKGLRARWPGMAEESPPGSDPPHRRSRSEDEVGLKHHEIAYPGLFLGKSRLAASRAPRAQVYSGTRRYQRGCRVSGPPDVELDRRSSGAPPAPRWPLWPCNDRFALGLDNVESSGSGPHLRYRRGVCSSEGRRGTRHLVRKGLHEAAAGR